MSVWPAQVLIKGRCDQFHHTWRLEEKTTEKDAQKCLDSWSLVDSDLSEAELISILVQLAVLEVTVPALLETGAGKVVRKLKRREGKLSSTTTLLRRTMVDVTRRTMTMVAKLLDERWMGITRRISTSRTKQPSRGPYHTPVWRLGEARTA